MIARNLFAIMLVAIATFPSSVSAQEAKSKSLELTIVVDKMPPEEKRTFRVHRDADVFGKQIENVCLRVDEKTLGLADVLVITRPKAPIENKEPKVHTIQFVGGNFDPPVLVASKGDRLRIVNKSQVPIIPHIVFPTVASPEESVRGIEVYPLENNSDFPVELTGNQIGLAHVYVQNIRACSLTSREGTCRVELLPEKEPGKRSKIQFWHVYMQSLQIKEPTPGLEMVRKNYLEVDFDQIVDGQKVTLIAKLRP